MTALTTLDEVRADVLTMIGASADNAVDDTLSRNDRRAMLLVNGVLHALLAKLPASADTHPKDGDVQQAPLVSGAVPKADAPNTLIKSLKRGRGK